MQTGFFITVEGGEGAGKTTVMNFIRDYLGENKIECVLTREFGGTEIAEKIRHILLSHHNEEMCPETELLLAFASRAQHLQRLILPTLATGKWVVSDRFTDSSYAYQGGGRGISEAEIAKIEQFVQRGFKPDFTILLDLDVESGFKRVSARSNGQKDRIESAELEMFKRVRQCYLDRAKHEPKRFFVLDASLPQEKVLANLQRVLEKIVAKWCE